MVNLLKGAMGLSALTEIVLGTVCTIAYLNSEDETTKPVYLCVAAVAYGLALVTGGILCLTNKTQKEIAEKEVTGSFGRVERPREY